MAEGKESTTEMKYDSIFLETFSLPGSPLFPEKIEDVVFLCIGELPTAKRFYMRHIKNLERKGNTITIQYETNVETKEYSQLSLTYPSENEAKCEEMCGALMKIKKAHEIDRMACLVTKKMMECM